MREEQAAAQAHAVSLEARRRAVISGVQAVDSFNEQMVTLITGEGALTILGDNLHVSHLTLEDGRLLVEGDISALEYDAAPRRRSLWARLTRLRAVLFYTLGQSAAFLLMLPAGLMTGLIWDGLCALRRLFQPGVLLSLAMDLTFCLMAAFLLIASLVAALHGEMRLYAVMGSIVGFLLYGATLSPLIALIARALLRLLRALGRRLAACALVRRLLK